MYHKSACIILLSVDMSRMNVWYFIVNIFDFYLSYCSLVCIENSTIQRINRATKPKNQLKNILLKDLSPNKIKIIVSNFSLKSY